MSDLGVKQNQSKAKEESGLLARMGVGLADWSEKWFPDAYVFAAAAVVVTVIAALLMGRSVSQIGNDFGGRFWDLVPFAMQMSFIIITGFVVATSKPVHKLIEVLSTIPKTAKGAVAFVAFFAMATSLISWGFSLIFSGILIKEISKKIQADYRAMGAAGYLGLGSIWALGLSSSAPLLMTTKSSIPAALYKISGVIPMSQTIFTWQNLVMIIVLTVLSVTIAYFSAPAAGRAKTAEMAGINYGNGLENVIPKREKPGEWLEYSPILNLFLVAVGAVYLFNTFSTKGGLAALDLNTYNFMFLMLGMLLHWTPKAFLTSTAKSIPAVGGVLIQFPLYAGIFGVMMGSGLNDVIMKFFVSISSQSTLAPIVGVYSAILGLFLPSGGGKWIVEAPYVLEAAKQLHVNMGWIVEVYNAAEALPNFINPFWMLPLMGLMGIKARDLAGYSILQLIFHAPVVIFMVWLLAKTLPYVAPVIQ